MAPLTWRNVDAPDLGRASDILNSVSRNWGAGFENLSGALDKARENQIRNRSAGAFDILARAASEGDVAGALSQIESTVRPQDRSDELTQAILNLRGVAQGYDTSRLNQQVTAAANDRIQTTHDRKIAVEDQLADMAGKIVGAQEDAMYGPRVGSARSSAGGNAPYNDRELLARTIQAEAGGEGYGGMIAAGSVINNRARSGKYGNGIRDVIMKPGQFSAWNGVTGYAGGEGGLDMTNMKVSEDAYKAADALLSGQYQDITGGATHYYNPAAADPEWGQRAGGQWTRIGNHVFGNPDGSSGAGQAPRISDIIGENNKVDPATLMKFVTDIQNSGDETSRDRDDNRNRDYEFNNKVDAQTIDKAATALAMAASQNTDFSDETTGYITDSDVSPEVKTAALAKIKDLPVDQIQALPFDPLRPVVAGPAETQIIADQYAADQSSAISGNQGVRILTNAEGTYNVPDPAKALVETLQLPPDSLGKTLSAIKQVQQGLKVSGIEASPATVAAVLQEAAERGSWYNPFEGSITWNTTEAIRLGRDILNPGSIKASSEMRTQAEQQQQGMQNLSGTIQKTAEKIQKMDARGEDTTELRGALGSLVNQAKGYQKAYPVVGRAPSSDEAMFPVDAAPKDILKAIEDGGGKANAAIQAQAETIVRSVISDLTGFSSEQISQMDTADLLTVITGIQRKLQSEGKGDDSPEFRQISQARDALIASIDRR